MVYNQYICTTLKLEVHFNTSRMAEKKRSNSRSRGDSAMPNTIKHTDGLADDLELFTQAVGMYNKSHPGDNVDVVRCTIEDDDVLTFTMTADKISSVLELNWKLSANLEYNTFDFAIENDRVRAATPYANWIGPRKRSNNKLILAAWVIVFALLVAWALFPL